MLATAGFPPWFGRDYATVIPLLARAGIQAIVPLSLYEEVGGRGDTGAALDFFPVAMGGTAAAFPYLREAGIKIHVPANLAYPIAQPIPAQASDQFGAWVRGSDGDLVGVFYSYDEPINNGISVARCQAVYNRVKAIRADLPVWQAFKMPPSAQVLQYPFDAFGFSIYPVQPVDQWQQLSGLVDLMRANAPGKELIGVLQGYGLRDLYTPAALAEVDPALVERSRPPTYDEMRRIAREFAGVDHLCWWGLSYLNAETDGPQVARAAMAVSQEIRRYTEAREKFDGLSLPVTITLPGAREIEITSVTRETTPGGSLAFVIDGEFRRNGVVQPRAKPLWRIINPPSRDAARNDVPALAILTELADRAFP